MQLLNFQNFVNEKYSPLNEAKSVKKFFSDLLNKIKGWFQGPGSWLKNLQKLKAEGGADMYKKLGIDFYDYSNEAVTESVVEGLLNEAETKNKRTGIDLNHPSPEVPNFTFEEMERALLAHWKNKTPPFIWGAPGIGKTDVVKQLAKKVGVKLILINLSMRDPVDFIGLPSIEAGKSGKPGRTVYNLPKFFPDDNGDTYDDNGKLVKEGPGGIIFFDELNRASGPVLSASLQLLLDRKIDEYELPSKWLIVAAGNRSVEAPEVNDLGPALSNRVKHYNLVPDVDSWVKWAGTKKDDEGNAMIDSKFIGFLLANKHYFHSYAGDPNTPWPSPRSWASAAMNYKTLLEVDKKNANNLDFVKRTLAADIGMDAASAFGNFIKLAEKFTDKDVNDVYNSPNSAKLPEKKNGNYVADVTYAILCMIVYNRIDNPPSSKEFINLLKYSERLGEFEFASALVKMAKSQFSGVLKDKAVIEALEKWVDAYQKDIDKMN